MGQLVRRAANEHGIRALLGRVSGLRVTEVLVLNTSLGICHFLSVKEDRRGAGAVAEVADEAEGEGEAVAEDVGE